MNRKFEVADFAAKLSIILERLNWSRGALAQRVGVDKSVVQRWASGRVVPTDSNLAALTGAVAQMLPGFGRADWRCPLPEFTQRFAGGAPVHPLAAIFPHATTVSGASAGSAAARYAGCWLLLHASVQQAEQPSVVGYIATIAQRGAMLWMEAEGSLQGTWRANGPVFALHRLVYLMLEDAVQGDSFAFGVLNGTLKAQAMVLDGVGSSASSSLRGPAAATRMVALRLDDRPDPAWREEAMRRIVRTNASGMIGALPASLSERFRMPAAPQPRAAILTVAAGSSLAADQADIAQGLAPDAAEAVAAARRICGLPPTL